MKTQKIITGLGLVLLLVFINFQIVEKERTIGKGKTVLLEIMPLGENTRLQGDYVMLYYTMTNELMQTERQDGYIILDIDSLSSGRADLPVGVFNRTQDEATPHVNGQIAVHFDRSKFFPRIGSNSFFVGKGTADKYRHAKYAALQIDGLGEATVTGLYDEQFRKLPR